MHGATYHWLVYIDVTIPYFEVETTSGVGTHPRLVVDCCPLAAKIGQRYKITSIALLALGETGVLHEATSQQNV